jgi:hypothetical protein
MLSPQSMKRVSLLFLCFGVLVLGALAKDVSVKGYFRKDGTYVAPHMRSAPNATALDNWSSKGNVNPYTGKPGTKDITSGGVGVLGAAGKPPPPAGSTRSTADGDKVFLESSFPKFASKLIPLVAEFRRSHPSEPFETRTTTQVLILAYTYLDSKGAADDFPELAIAVASSLTRSESTNLNSGGGATTAPGTSDSTASSGVPFISQWRRIRSLQSMDEVENVLGKPRTISNSGSGERWEWEGGGWVDFYLSGNVAGFGGYSSSSASKIVPFISQWRRIRSLQSMDEVENVLGKPRTISNSGSGERWEWEGGGWVDFYLSGNVARFGGYDTKN